MSDELQPNGTTTAAETPSPGPTVRPRPGSDSHGRWSTVLTLVLLMAIAVGAGYATWPLWSGRVMALIPGMTADGFQDPRVAGLAERVRLLEEATTALRQGSVSEKDLEAEYRQTQETLAAVVARVEALDGELRSLRQMAGAVEPPAAKIGQALDSLDHFTERLARMEQSEEALKTLVPRLTHLEEVIAATGGGAGTPVVPSPDLENLHKRLQSLEKREADAIEAATGARATVLAVGQLREVLQSPRPFTAELQALVRLAPNSSGLLEPVAAIQAYAPHGIPTLAMLRDRFGDMAGEVVHAAAALKGDGWWEKTANRLSRLVTIRRIDAADNSAEGLVAEAERQLDVGDLPTAVAVLERLQGSPAEAARPWLAAAHARVAAERTMAALHVHALSLLGGRGE